MSMLRHLFFKFAERFRCRDVFISRLQIYFPIFLTGCICERQHILVSQRLLCLGARPTRIPLLSFNIQCFHSGWPKVEPENCCHSLLVLRWKVFAIDWPLGVLRSFALFSELSCR